MISDAFSPQPPQCAAQLPLTLINLQDWSLSTLSGADSDLYLQGQITADVRTLTADQHGLAAHCDAKGKMWSTLRLFRNQHGFSWIERRSLQAGQLAELKKYAVFSKVTIQPDDNAVLLGIAGAGARAALAAHFPQLPDQRTPLIRHNVDHHESSILLWFDQPCERFLLISDASGAQRLLDALPADSLRQTSDQWLALDIEAGYPVLDAATSQQFLPQACNVQALQGISYKKGCYSGQEMVARARFRGANKRALYCLQGQASRLPEATEDLELQLNDQWRRTGSVLAAVRLADHSVLIQAILNNDLPADALLRVRGQSEDPPLTLRIAPLPYPVQEPQ